MNEGIKIALALAGMPQEQITQIEQTLPVFLRLLSDQNKADINTVIPVVKNIIKFAQSKSVT